MRILVSLAALVLSLAPAAAPGQQKQAAAKAARPSAVADGELEKKIQERFARSKISVNGFKVKVQGGVAIIEGNTNVLQHKGTATRLARLAGAAKVDNRIQVSEAARRKASDNLAQGRRRAQVKRSEAPGR